MDRTYLSSSQGAVATERMPRLSGKIFTAPMALRFGLRTTSGRNRVLLACALLLVLATAVFHTALTFFPGTADDLELLSSVAHTTQPMKYLVGDFGMGPYETGNYGQYRPLHTISLWIVYKLVGPRFFPNQLINFTLDFLNAALVLLLIWRSQKDLIFSFVGAALFLVSVHTMSAPTWVSDRPNLLVGLALILLLHHVVKIRQSGSRLQIPYVLFLCLFALLSKESGLIVPVLALVISMREVGPTLSQRIRTSAIWAAVIAFYFLGRIEMFGKNAFSYSTFGYLFGLWPYSLGSALPSHLRHLTLVDNVAKNIVEPFLPLFNEAGGFSFKFDPKATALGVALGALAMVVLTSLTVRKKLTPLQVDCLWVVLLNAIIHNAIFRYRDLYIAQIAICLLIACSPRLNEPRRRALALAAAFLLLMVSVVRVDNTLRTQWMSRYIEFNDHNLADTLQSFHGRRVDPKLAQQILERYRDRDHSF